jgi:hypothetical protein
LNRVCGSVKIRDLSAFQKRAFLEQFCGPTTGPLQRGLAPQCYLRIAAIRLQPDARLRLPLWEGRRVCPPLIVLDER